MDRSSSSYSCSWPRIILLGLISTLSWGQVFERDITIVLVVIFGSFLGIGVGYFFRRYWLWPMAFSLFYFPAFGVSTLTAFLALYLFFTEFGGPPFRKQEQEGRSRVVFPALVLILSFVIPLVGSFLNSFDFVLAKSVFHYSGIVRWYQVMLSAYTPWREGFYFVVGVCLFTLIVDFFNRSKMTSFDEQVFQRGLCHGALYAVGFFFAHFLAIHPLFIYVRNPFWEALGRYSASFSDPNAFGVMGALLVPLLWTARNRMSRFAALLFFAVVLWSGSRTFLLGLMLVALVTLGLWWGKAKSNQRQRLWLFGSVIIVGMICIGVLCQAVRPRIPVPAIARLVDTLKEDTAAEMFSSRFIFSRLALAVWKESPLIGVGLGNFKEKIAEASQTSNIELNGWRDNANNFYLHVLAEGGLLGLALLFLACGIAYKRMRQGKIELAVFNKPVLHSTLISFAILLFTGPHVFFEEVRYLLAMFLGFFFCGMGSRLSETLPGGLGAGNIPVSESSRSVIRGKKLEMASVFLIVLYLCLVGLQLQGRKNYGFYGIEQGKRQGKNFRFAWSVEAAQISFCDRLTRRAVLNYRSFDPELGSSPLEVTFTGFLDDQLLGQEVVQVSDSKLRGFELRRVGTQATMPNRVKIDVSRLWSPSVVSASGDWRWLGVLVRWPEKACRD